ncbi:diaminopimelate epimerase [Allomuricauda sp. d1]|uniref:diaminopimelate epimerase n=1 Tax=Allomuricauda sp. d1 TaxID=3136725 RepID=UPI0031D2675F
MQLKFHKYQGTGNDFILVDNRQLIFPKNDTKLIALLCNRRFGVGADGLILLENDKMSDFKMVYFNSDGNESSMCGNGGRCIVAFAKELGLVENDATFNAVDGLHTASIQNNNVTLQMVDVTEVKSKPKSLFLNTGSPHHVQLVNDLQTLDVKTEGAKLRYGLYGKAGSNINFVQPINADTFEVRTYERGVEGETLSCGTGVTAVAIAMHHAQKTASDSITIKTLGGELKVSFQRNGKGYGQIKLSGPATLVYKGEISC